MKRRLLLVLALAALLAADKPKKDAAKADQKKLQGTWKVVSAERNGQAFDDATDAKIAFTGAKAKIDLPSGEVMEFTFKLDPSKKPKAIDFTVTSGDKKGQKSLAIYEIKGDNLKLCGSEAGTDKRPADFKSESDDIINLVLKRAKKS